jgi:hypothetical protein
MRIDRIEEPVCRDSAAPNKRSHLLQMATKPADTRPSPGDSVVAPHSAEKLSLASATERAHPSRMFDYRASADLYTKQSGMNVRRKTVYRRFSSAADAIHFAVERLTPEMLENALLEVDEKRFTADQIRGLYDDTTFPLQRNRRDGS